ncbi:MAG: VIT1/CCC1 transporter family protein [Candidatus Woesearchaeota archaeon]
MNVMLAAQKNEITEHIIYSRLAKKSRDVHNKKTLERLSSDELKHYEILKKHTKIDVSPKRFKIWFYSFLATIFGISFTIRLMEHGEEYAQKLYSQQKDKDFKVLLVDEHRHEKDLIEILKDSRVEYAGSIVLGLNDALVELTGALAGLSLALANGKLIAVIGGITGFAAAMSMAASSYLSSKEEKNNKDAFKGATYTGVAYLITVTLLILPFIFINNVFISMVVMLCITILIIAVYTFYISTAKGTGFWPKFIEMALISLTVAAISFVIGWIVRRYIGVDA